MGRKNATLQKLSALSKMPRKLADVFEFIEELHASSDRGFAILVAVDVENALDDAIAAFIDPRYRNELLSFSGPCGTFSAKILLGRTMGVYGDETYRNLEIIRNIRNAFAHSKMPLNFSVPEVAEACGLLKIPDRILPREHDDPEPDPTNSIGRERYHVVCQQLESNLHWQASRTSQAPSVEDLPQIEAAEEFTIKVVGKPLP